MREIQASEAKVHLPQLLDDVERGETLIITRHGRRIARIVPELDRRQEEIDKALTAIRDLRKRYRQDHRKGTAVGSRGRTRVLMSFVLDASITACWAFADEDHPEASLAFDRIRTEEAVVPSLWWFEVRNILVVNERRQRIAESDTAAFLLHLSRLRIRVDRIPEENTILRLARTYRLSVYDAAYLELAQRQSLPLATLDADLRRAAAGEGVVLLTRGLYRRLKKPASPRSAPGSR